MFNNGQFISCKEKKAFFFPVQRETKETNSTFNKLASVDPNTTPTTTTTTTTIIPLNNSGIDQRHQFINQQMQAAMNEKDREIYRRNNERLNQMEREIRSFDTYGLACDELLVWLNDDRAYNEHNEQALLNCIVAIYEKHKEFGIYSGIKILETANENCRGLSENGRGKIFYLLSIMILYKLICYWYKNSNNQKIFSSSSTQLEQSTS